MLQTCHFSLPLVIYVCLLTRKRIRFWLKCSAECWLSEKQSDNTLYFNEGRVGFLEKSWPIEVYRVILSIILGYSTISRCIIQYLQRFELLIQQRLINFSYFLSKTEKILIISISDNLSSFSKSQKPPNTTKSFQHIFINID